MTGMGIILLILGILFGGEILLFMLFISIFIFIFGDILIGFQITTNELKPLMDKTKKGYELTEFEEITGRVHFINTKKEGMGIRRFLWHGKEAAVINDGVGMVTFPGGNRGFRSHESYDKSISSYLCKALESLSKKTDVTTGDIKEIYDNAIKMIDDKAIESVKVDASKQQTE